ncbi:MAG TPA: prepilin-type N-terminal cleavage/methylation domain-containing protein [Candidatus Saccharimonadales bacterium]|nr:prepilin-type N-terminal cleavage/methylation domain-containing protein [Candidatus Saccharimonadales bacterium]
MINLQQTRGDTLVEVVIALAILAVTFAVAYNSANLSYQTSVQAREGTVAAQLLEDQAEKLRVYRDQQVAANLGGTNDIFSAFASGGVYYMNANDQVTPGPSTTCTGLPSQSQCSVAIDITKTSYATQPYLNEIQAHIIVQWDSLIGGLPNTSDLTYYLTDTRPVPTICDNSLAGQCQ